MKKFIDVEELETMIEELRTELPSKVGARFIYDYRNDEKTIKDKIEEVNLMKEESRNRILEKINDKDRITFEMAKFEAFFRLMFFLLPFLKNKQDTLELFNYMRTMLEQTIKNIEEVEEDGKKYKLI